MRVFYRVILACIMGCLAGGTLAMSWKSYQESYPQDVLDDIVANDDSDIIETELDKTYNTQIYGAEYKAAGTTESVRQNLAIYLQWMAFIGLTASVILIVYNGLLLVLSPLSPDQVSKVRTRIIYLSAGVLLITGFYFILKVFLAVLIDILVR